MASQIQLLDIGGGQLKSNIREEIIAQLDEAPGKKTLPFSILYNAAGLDLYDQITRVDDYYIDRTERIVLKDYAEVFADQVEPETRLIELGSGNLDKVRIILDAFERRAKPVEYFALDIDLGELRNSFQKVPVGEYKHVSFYGLHGSYDNCLQWLKSGAARRKVSGTSDHTRKHAVNGDSAANAGRKGDGIPLCVFSLGSSIGNFKPSALKDLLSSYASVMQPNDSILLSSDTCEDLNKIYTAFNDSLGLTTEFYLNGINFANELLSVKAQPTTFDMNSVWQLRTEMDTEDRSHRAFLVPSQDVDLNLGDGVNRHIAKDERVELEQYRSYPKAAFARLVQGTGLKVDKPYERSGEQDWAFYRLVLE